MSHGKFFAWGQKMHLMMRAIENFRIQQRQGSIVLAAP